MAESQKKQNIIRRKILFASFLISIVLFSLITPIISWIDDIVTSPTAVTNLEVVQEGQRISMSWDSNTDFDFSNYLLQVGENARELASDKQNEIFNVEEFPVEVSFFSVDWLGTSSRAINFTIEQQDTSAPQVTEYNIQEVGAASTSNIYIQTGIVLVLSIFLSFFVFNFKIPSIKSAVLILYPSLATFPLILFAVSLLSYEEINNFVEFFLSVAFGLIFFIVTYFIFLTVNILRVSLEVELPLEQAAKASQFIFSLVAAYIILIVFFGSELSFLEKNAVILPFISYYTFAAIQMLKGVSLQQATARTFAITLTIFLSIFVFSIWPSTGYVFPILAIAVCYYILLSIALEVRKHIAKYFWLEYVSLIALVTLLIILNSSWGINGTLI